MTCVPLFPQPVTEEQRAALLAGTVVITHGPCVLRAVVTADGETRLRMAGPSGAHSLLAVATDAARLTAHWRTFCAHTLNRPMEA